MIFMTDDSDAERNALAKAWAGAILLLCIFHVLQAQWTWLWKSRHGIHPNHKAHLLNLFRNVLFADNEEDLSKREEEMFNDSVMLSYPQYRAHLDQDTFPKIEAWSLAKRASHPTTCNNTNNLV